MFENKKIGMIGCGKMGAILLQGILRRSLVSAGQILVADAVRERIEEIRKAHPEMVAEENGNLARQADILILAVKPQNMSALLDEISAAVHPGQLIISIAAGISTRQIEKHFSGPVRVVRVMPNTPALVGEGATALAAGSSATAADLETAGRIFEAVGLTVTVAENLMDAVTGLSGSGPGYVFVMPGSPVRRGGVAGVAAGYRPQTGGADLPGGRQSSVWKQANILGNSKIW